MRSNGDKPNPGVHGNFEDLFQKIKGALRISQIAHQEASFIAKNNKTSEKRNLLRSRRVKGSRVKLGGLTVLDCVPSKMQKA